MGTGVSVVIQATDRATKTIDGINKRLRAVAAPGERFARSIGKLADTTGLTAASRSVATLTRNVVAGAASLGRFAPALGALTSAASIAGLASLTERWSDFGTRLGLDSRRIGTTADRLHGLQGAARLAGVSADDLTSGMRTLGDTMFNAAAGRAPQAAMLFDQLGVSFRDARTGAARLADEAMPELADRIAAIRNPTLQAMVATELFGGAGEQLLPFLRKGAAGMAEYRREAERYGVMNQRGVDAANALRMAQTKLGLAVEGVGYSVAQALAPVLVPALERLSAWVAAHREDIAAFFERVAKGLVSWVEGGGIERTIASLERFGGKVNEVVQFFGGWEAAAIAVGVALTASVLAPLTAIALKLAFFSAWTAPRWMLALLGIGGTAASATTAAGLGMAAAGAYSGSRNLPMTDDMGNIVGNWGGQGGEERWKAYNDTLGKGPPQTFWGTLQRMFGFGGGGLDTGSGRGGMTPGEAARGGTPQLGASAPSLGNAEQQARARQAFDHFVGQGRSPEQASGLVARMKLESGFNEGAVGDNRTAAGAMQWHGDRRNILAGAGIPVVGGTFNDHLRAVDYELDHNERAAGQALARTRTASEAGYVTSRQYIRPGLTEAVREWEAQRTGVLAEQYLRSFQAAPAATPRLGSTAAPPVQAPPAQAAPVQAPPAPVGAAGANGTVTANINIGGAPPGTSQNVTTTGDVQMGGMRISRPGIGFGMGSMP